MFIGMTKDRRKDLETLGEAAHRLLQGMDARKKRPAAEMAAPIHFPGECPNVPGEKRQGTARILTCAHVPCRVTLSGGGVSLGFDRDANANVLRAGFHANENAFTSLWEMYAVTDDDGEWL